MKNSEHTKMQNEILLRKYIGRPLTVDAVQEMKCELARSGCNTSRIDVSSGEAALSLEALPDGDCVTHFIRENGMWETDTRLL